MTKKRKIEYALNAIVYCMWYYRVKFQEFSNQYAIKIGTIMAMCIHSAEHMEKKHPEYVANELRKSDEFWRWRDKEHGLGISLIYDNFHWICGFYGLSLAIPLLIISELLFRDLFVFSDLRISFVVFFLGTFAIPILANRMVFRKNRYLDYFMLFENEDKRWLKKWRWITLAFCVGPFVLLPLIIILIITLFKFNR